MWKEIPSEAYSKLRHFAKASNAPLVEAYAGIHVAEASGQVSADAGEESTGLLDAALGHGHGNACPLRQQ